MQKIKKIFLVSGGLQEKLAELKLHFGHFSEAETLRMALSELHSHTFPAYVQVQQKRLNKVEDTPETKARKVIAMNDARKNIMAEDEYIEGKRICDILEGETKENGKGNFSCRWKTHDRLSPTIVQSYEMTLPFEQLSDELIFNQYTPDRESVEEVYKKKKNDN